MTVCLSFGRTYAYLSYDVVSCAPADIIPKYIDVLHVRKYLRDLRTYCKCHLPHKYLHVSRKYLNVLRRHSITMMTTTTSIKAGHLLSTCRLRLLSHVHANPRTHTRARPVLLAVHLAASVWRAAWRRWSSASRRRPSSSHVLASACQRRTPRR